MRILLATDYYPPTIGGISNAVYTLAKALVQSKHDVYVLAPSTSWKFYKEEDEGIIVYRIRSVMIQKERLVRHSPGFLHQKEVREIIKEVRPDIIHIHTPDFIATTAVRVGKRMRIPLIGTGHIMPENAVGALYGMLAIPEKIGKIVGDLYIKQMIQLYNKLDFVSVPTQSGVDILKAYGLKVPLQAISNGINLEAFSHLDKSKLEKIEKKFNFPKKTRLLYVGRLDKEKRLDVLLQAITLLKDRNDFHVIIAGKGVMGRTLQKHAKKLGIKSKVSFTGFISDADLPYLYSLCNIFVMPSTAELQCLVVMEAMAAGLAVVAANAVALPLLVKDKQNGLLFEPDSPSHLAQKLDFLISNNNQQQKMGAQGKEMIQSHDIEQVVRKWEYMYTKVIRQKKVDANKIKKTLKKNMIRKNISRILSPLL